MLREKGCTARRTLLLVCVCMGVRADKDYLGPSAAPGALGIQGDATAAFPCMYVWCWTSHLLHLLFPGLPFVNTVLLRVAGCGRLVHAAALYSSTICPFPSVPRRITAHSSRAPNFVLHFPVGHFVWNILVLCSPSRHPPYDT